MDRKKQMKNRVLAAAGSQKAGLVLKHARVFNVFTEELEELDVAIEGGIIVGLGEYEGKQEVDMEGRVICPGLIDGHIHMESSMVSPAEFEKAVVPHGTTAVITDPHEICNVAGTTGLDYMLAMTEPLILDVCFMLPSCVPSTELDEAGAVLEAESLRPYYSNDRVLGLAEVMNSYGTVMADGRILDKVLDADACKKVIDGHAPGLGGKGLNAYATAGVRSDHECSSFEDAREKIRRGQWIMVRQGTAAKNLEALLPVFEAPYYQRAMLVTDDKHPGDLIHEGHIDGIIREAVSRGASPAHAVRMGSLNAALYFGLKDRGAVAPGYRADLVVVDSLESFRVQMVYKDGRLVSENGKFIINPCPVPEISKEMEDRVMRSFHLERVKEEDFRMEEAGEKRRVILLTEGELLTQEWIVDAGDCVSGEKDIVKLAVLERHNGTGHIGLGYLGGYGLKKGAVASSIAHDSHNLIVAGTNDRDMAVAANCVRENQGGLAYAVDGKIAGELVLPIAGLMSPDALEVVDEGLERLKRMLEGAGITHGIDPFMTLAFVSLPVIPKLRLNTFGVIDVGEQRVVPGGF